MIVALEWLTKKRVGALLFFGLSVFYGWQIPDIPSLPVDALEAMNARSMPWALAICGGLLSLALFVSGGPITTGASESSAQLYLRANVLAAVVLLIWTGLYANLLGWLGFFAATLVFLLGGFYLLGERRPRVLFGVGFVASGLLYALLRLGLGLFLPSGSLWPALFGAPNV